MTMSYAAGSTDCWAEAAGNKAVWNRAQNQRTTRRWLNIGKQLNTGSADGLLYQLRRKHFAQLAGLQKASADHGRLSLVGSQLRQVYGKTVNRSFKSVWLAASLNKGVTLKISSTVRSVEPCV